MCVCVGGKYSISDLSKVSHENEILSKRFSRFSPEASAYELSNPIFQEK